MVKGEKLKPQPIIIALWIVMLLATFGSLWLALQA